MQLAFSLKRTHSMTGFYITTWNKILGRDIYYEWWMCGIWAMRNNRLDNLWEGTYQIIIIRHDHWYQMISSISIDHVWMLHYLPFVFFLRMPHYQQYCIFFWVESWDLCIAEIAVPISPKIIFLGLRWLICSVSLVRKYNN